MNGASAAIGARHSASVQFIDGSVSSRLIVLFYAIAIALAIFKADCISARPPICSVRKPKRPAARSDCRRLYRAKPMVGHFREVSHMSNSMSSCASRLFRASHRSSTLKRRCTNASPRSDAPSINRFGHASCRVKLENRAARVS